MSVLLSWNSEVLFGVPGHMHFITLYLANKRKLRSKNDPRDESRVWLGFCDSNMDKSLVLTVRPVTQWTRPVVSHGDGA